MLAAFLVTAVQSTALAAWKEITVVNETGRTIKFLQISRYSDHVDTINQLKKPLKNGASVKIPFQTLNTEETDFYELDMSVSLEDATVDIWWTFRFLDDISVVKKITIYRKNGDYAIRGAKAFLD